MIQTPQLDPLPLAEGRTTGAGRDPPPLNCLIAVSYSCSSLTPGLFVLILMPERFINVCCVLVSSPRDTNTMTVSYRSRIPTAYRVLPARWRILESEGSYIRRTGQYVLDEDLNRSEVQPVESAAAPIGDLLDLILGSQARAHAAAASTLSRLILSRRALTRKQIDDIEWRLDQMVSRRPLAPPLDGKIPEVEKQIIDLERQKRQAEVNEWRDVLELRRAMADERRAYSAAKARSHYLGGGSSGAN